MSVHRFGYPMPDLSFQNSRIHPTTIGIHCLSVLKCFGRLAAFGFSANGVGCKYGFDLFFHLRDLALQQHQVFVEQVISQAGRSILPIGFVLLKQAFPKVGELNTHGLQRSGNAQLSMRHSAAERNGVNPTFVTASTQFVLARFPQLVGPARHFTD